MEPASALAVAGVALQLADTALEIATNLTRYYRSVREGPARSAELRDEIETFADLFKSVQEYGESNFSQSVKSILIRELSVVRKLLDDLRKRTLPKQTAGIRGLIWPFKAKENEELIAKIAGHKGTVSVCLQVNQG
jgi:hypothetical protein